MEHIIAERREPRTSSAAKIAEPRALAAGANPMHFQEHPWLAPSVHGKKPHRSHALRDN